MGRESTQFIDLDQESFSQRLVIQMQIMKDNAKRDRYERTSCPKMISTSLPAVVLSAWYFDAQSVFSLVKYQRRIIPTRILYLIKRHRIVENFKPLAFALQTSRWHNVLAMVEGSKPKANSRHLRKTLTSCDLPKNENYSILIFNKASKSLLIKIEETSDMCTS